VDILGKRFHRLQLTSSSQEKTAKVRHQTFELSRNCVRSEWCKVTILRLSVCLGRWFQLYDMEKGEALSEMSQGEMWIELEQHAWTWTCGPSWSAICLRRLLRRHAWESKWRSSKVEQGATKSSSMKLLLMKWVTKVFPGRWTEDHVSLTDSPTRKYIATDTMLTRGPCPTPFLHENLQPWVCLMGAV
jgi:hypothetical protein